MRPWVILVSCAVAWCVFNYISNTLMASANEEFLKMIANIRTMPYTDAVEHLRAFRNDNARSRFASWRHSGTVVVYRYPTDVGEMRRIAGKFLKPVPADTFLGLRVDERGNVHSTRWFWPKYMEVNAPEGFLSFQV